MGYKRIEAFKAGTHIDAAGVERVFTEADLQQIADSFNPKVFRVPLVPGHPKDDTPVVGLIGKVERVGDTLFLTPEHIHPDFLSDLEVNRIYTDVSVSLYHPDDNRNPFKGQWALKHLGLLGATAPAVKGLAGIPNPLHYNEVVSGASDTLRFSVFKLPENLIEQTQSPIYKEYSIMTEAEIAAMQAELEAQRKATAKAEQEKLALQQQLDAEKKNAAQALAETEAAAFCEEQVKAGRLTPAVKSQAVALYALLKTNATDEISFGESKVAPVVLFKRLIEGLPKSVEFGEVAGVNKGDTRAEKKPKSRIAELIERQNKAQAGGK